MPAGMGNLLLLKLPGQPALPPGFGPPAQARGRRGRPEGISQARGEAPGLRAYVTGFPRNNPPAPPRLTPGASLLPTSTFLGKGASRNVWHKAMSQDLRWVPSCSSSTWEPDWAYSPTSLLHTKAEVGLGEGQRGHLAPPCPSSELRP